MKHILQGQKSKELTFIKHYLSKKRETKYYAMISMGGGFIPLTINQVKFVINQTVF